jgi:hypothetical protein
MQTLVFDQMARQPENQLFQQMLASVRNPQEQFWVTSSSADTTPPLMPEEVRLAIEHQNHLGNGFYSVCAAI